MDVKTTRETIELLYNHDDSSAVMRTAKDLCNALEASRAEVEHHKQEAIGWREQWQRADHGAGRYRKALEEIRDEWVGDLEAVADIARAALKE